MGRAASSAGFQPGNPHRFQPGKSGNPAGNPFMVHANEFRAEFYRAATPDRKAALMNLLWEQALGLYRAPDWDEELGCQKTHPDGSWKFKPPCEPQPWAQKLIMEFIGGSVSFKAVEASLSVEVTDSTERAREVTRTLIEEGMGHLVTPAMRALVEVDATGLPE